MTVSDGTTDTHRTAGTRLRAEACRSSVPVAVLVLVVAIPLLAFFVHNGRWNADSQRRILPPRYEIGQARLDGPRTGLTHDYNVREPQAWPDPCTFYDERDVGALFPDAKQITRRTVPGAFTLKPQIETDTGDIELPGYEVSVPRQSCVFTFFLSRDARHPSWDKGGTERRAPDYEQEFPVNAVRIAITIHDAGWNTPRMLDPQPGDVDPMGAVQCTPSSTDWGEAILCELEDLSYSVSSDVSDELLRGAPLRAVQGSGTTDKAQDFIQRSVLTKIQRTVHTRMGLLP